ncbi:MAG TPA: metallophosphoesterase family protein [Terriglobales bacterium]|jgi:predicted phosphodiesterase|nr:metallophosphoesterase family protein [Terriglobales bacterium]
MRILLLSDIHSNLEALEACLAAAPDHNRVFNLGDVVGYGASPNEVTFRARSLGEVFVRGNHDKAVSGIDNIESFNPVAGLAALWNRDHLDAGNLAWLRDLPHGPVRLPELPDVQLVHGSPEDEDRYVVNVQDALGPLAATDVPITFFGHTHIQGLFRLHAGVVEAIYPEYQSLAKAESWSLDLESGSSYMINPGSVGQPRDGDWRAGFGVFDTETRTMSFCRTPYNLRSAQERIFSANLPPRLGTRLAAGR